ncbi:MAG TPA: PH domain-containing protein [Acidimicrobiia bacterium]|nr:PH domain-containing protein [Acidimicrobiia bacterium]
MLYDDGRIACDDDAITIRWYYLWGAKRIPYRSIRSVTARTMTGVRGRWRIWGSGDLVHWYNLDGNRPNKQVALELDVGRRVKPTITPDEPETVRAILDAHLA